MAKNKNVKVTLENVELKPQVIGYTYQKKNNLGRVLIIFISFILVIYYINDISIFFNNLLGRTTAETIREQGSEKEEENPSSEEGEKTLEEEYNLLSDSLTINEKGLVLENFKTNNNILSFDVSNKTSSSINLKDSKYFLETYSENKTLLERFKVDFNLINANSKITLNYNITEPIYYLVLSEKKVDDYPVVNLEEVNGLEILTCTKDFTTFTYKFKNSELVNIDQTVKDENTSDTNYNSRYTSYQSKTTTYNNIDGITASFAATPTGYTAMFSIDLEKADLSNINETYYFKNKELAKVVNFEMETYGFNCN